MLLLVFLLLPIAVFAQPNLQVSGGITVNGAAQPLLFTWNAPVAVSGGGWAPGEEIRVSLHGPFDSLEVAPRPVRGHLRVAGRPAGPPSLAAADIPLATFTADAQGNLSAAPRVPFDSGMVGAAARIPRPGYYEVRAFGRVSGAAYAAGRVEISPETRSANIDWGRERGGRDGVFPDTLRQVSPERFDPEWLAAWDQRPVELYGTIAPPDAPGADQPARISPSDNPPTHYAHDAILFVTPDPGYRWLVGTANFAAEPDAPGRGRIEVEWETQNAGGTATYGQGSIGLPLWATPTVRDRVYVVGRWVLDAGHPELGDRTEIHPPRLVAVMRNGAAAQVDLYVSGHGGGANRTPPGLERLLDQGGHGGGRIRDVLSPAEQERYYRAGPLAPLLYPLLVQLIRQLTGVTITSTIYPEAGPSSFPWGAPGAEESTINDRDYDFDVPLPPPPGPGAPLAIETVTHAGHATAVNEVVTIRGSTAHVHLPYRGADNRVYARTLKLAWNTPTPVRHWIVRLNRIDVNDAAGKWHLWADVGGQWRYLTGAAPELLNTTAGRSVALPATATDVYLAGDQQPLRVYVQGYRAACLDDFFGKLFGQTSYAAGMAFVAPCGPSDNLDLGGAVLELPSATARGSYTVTAGSRHFAVAISVDVP